ncbi:MAG: lysylphosphatidylglycerol synthase transmembrane domain-containing protein [Bacteroidota bacterium]
MKTLLQSVIGVSLAAGLLYLTYRNMSLEEIWANVSKADPTMVILAGCCLLAVFLFRGLRWQMMLDATEYSVGKYNTVLAVLVGYLVNTATPRLGEVARCTLLYRTDKVPVATSFGTVFSERVVDLVVLLLGLGVIFLLEVERLAGLFRDIFTNLATMLEGSQNILIGLGVIGLIGLGVLIWLLRAKSFQEGLIGKVKAFLQGMIDAAKSIFKLKNPFLFFVHTFMIWASLVAMTWCFMEALPITRELSLYYSFLVLLIGGIGWALPTPGGMGTTHAIVTQLFIAMELSGEAGKTIALLSNGGTNLYTILFGFIGLVLAWLVVMKVGKK